MILTCTECEKKLKVNDDMAGKKVRCPKCKALVVVSIPEDDAVSDDPPPRKKTALAKKKPQAPIVEDDDNDDDDSTPPQKKTSKKPKPTDVDDELDDDDDDDERLRCAKCRSTEVVQLPPDQWSRNPGFECEACGATMRQPGTTGFLLFVTMLGGFISLLGVGLLIGAFAVERYRGRSIGGAVMIGFAGISAATWAVRQIFLPIPLNAPAKPSRIWLWILLPIVIIFVLLVCVGGGIFGLMYYMQEMM